MSSLVLIDGNPLMWRAAYAKSEEYICEGIITFFFDIVKKFEGADVLLFWDAGKSRWRTECYPEYKAQRQARKDTFDLAEMGEQKKQARRILSYFGVRDFVVPGVEADDLIAWFSEYYAKEYDRIVIASRDHDLWQLITDKIIVYDPKERLIHDKSSVVSHMGMAPSLIADYKAICGDVSDNIKGVKGVGPGTALPLLQAHGGLDVLLNEKESELRKKAKTQKILTQYEELSLSYRLVKCPTLLELPYVMSNEEIELLKLDLKKEVVVDSFKAQIELEILGNFYRIHSTFLSGLSERMVGLGTYLDSLDNTVHASIADVDASLSACNKCPLWSASPQFSKGSTKAEVMVLASTFIKDSEMERIEGLLEDSVKIPPKLCWIASACRCESLKPVTYGEVRACSGYIKAEIGLTKPKLIISIGDEAMSLVSDYHSESSRHSGEIFKNDELGAYVAILPGFRDQKKADWDYGVSQIEEFLAKKRGE